MAELIRTGQISPVELTNIMLNRINLLDSGLHSYCYLMEEQARKSAHQAEQEIRQGHYRGPLHGIPLAVKDLCYTRDIPTRGGLKVLNNFIPEFDATVVAKLKSAGAILLGKLTLTEGAVGGYHRNFPIPRNPWGKNLWTGSSSSGSGVAVAAGLCYGALGSDTGGSIRFPAMACGITGLKPTYGRVSRYGILPLAESLDHVGPMTRSVADAAAIFDVISGPDKNDPTTLSEDLPNASNEIGRNISGIKIGYDPEYSSADVDPSLIRTVETTLDEFSAMGAIIVQVKVPDVSEIRDIWKTICTYEAAKAHSAHYPSRAEDYGSFFGDFLEFGYNTDRQTYIEAGQKRALFNQEFDGVWAEVELLACPGAGVPCSIPEGLLYGSLDEIRSYMNPNTYFQFTIPANFGGLPTLSFPCGTSVEGPPYTLQLVGPKNSEAALCRVGTAYQQATLWHRQFPGI
jgi:amidase